MGYPTPRAHRCRPFLVAPRLDSGYFNPTCGRTGSGALPDPVREKPTDSQLGGHEADSPRKRIFAGEMKPLSFPPTCGCKQSPPIDRDTSGNLRAAAKELGYSPAVPPKRSRVDSWKHDGKSCRRRAKSNCSFGEPSDSGECSHVMMAWT